MRDLAVAVRHARAWACNDCGKCTATCPIARVGGEYSPRRQVLAALEGGRPESVIDSKNLFRCLTCDLCVRRCPAEVAYTELVQQVRESAHAQKAEPDCPHGGALQSLMRMMARGTARQNRLDWLDDALETAPAQGPVFFWTGCAVYYDAFFAELGLSTVAANRAAVRVLNHLGVKPVVSPDERCCGHDLLWNGDRENFERLARFNTQLVADSGAATVVVSCAECLRTWRRDYAPFISGRPPRILHISEFLVERLPELRFPASGGRRVTFQDPCRLGRHLGVYEPPRKLLAALPGVELADMRRSGPAAICCAGGTWSGCDRYAKQIQVERLREARATGAEILVTACPKCRIHLRCAMKDPRLGPDIEIELRDVAELVAAALA